MKVFVVIIDYGHAEFGRDRSRIVSVASDKPTALAAGEEEARLSKLWRHQTDDAWYGDDGAFMWIEEHEVRGGVVEQIATLAPEEDR